MAFTHGGRPVTRAQWGDAFAVQVTNLRPRQTVTLVASTTLSLGGSYSSKATFVADDGSRGHQRLARGQR